MRVTVKSVSGQVQVELNTNETELTPALAKQARNAAFGSAANATVTKGNTAYRVTKSGARRVEVEYHPDYD